MPTPYNLTPLEILLEEETPAKLAELIDEMLLILVCYSDTQVAKSRFIGEGVLQLADRYHTLRLLRDSFSETSQPAA